MPHLRTALSIALLALPALPAAAQNLIVNGSFEAGFSGFSTEYAVSPTGCIGCVGIKPTTLAWYNVPSLVFSYGDHTSGSGQMLQYDPPGGSTPKIWSQTVAVNAGTAYVFSGWLREANSEPGPNGRVGVYAGGTLLGTHDATNGGWTQWSFTWTAPGAPGGVASIELALRDLNTNTFGGTYSTIDDLVFAPVPEPAAAATLLAGLCGLTGAAALRRRRPA